ncbi:substrate-binding periplasmic protein [Psychromonas aquimarina]|uniref:substrate-binding periplasmic protein n=1 Tax=Psychromonas aquimarina TaxID=444919 RepID=UPI000490EC09|nr:transporter substrate-binding domain-containing protein [Psychromonas aquimarina]
MKLTYILFFILFSSFCYADADKSIEMVTDQWPPYYGANMYNQGPVTEISRRVLNKLGYQAKVTFVPWKRALEHSKQGHYDAVLGAYFNNERSVFFWHSDAVASSRVVLFSYPENYKQASDLSAINGHSVCVINGYFYSDEFTSSSLISKIKSNTLKHCFERLIARRVDYVAADKLVGQAILDEQFPGDRTKLTTLPIIISQQTIHILWSKKTPGNFQLNKSFNSTLQELKKSGEIEQIWQKHGFQSATGKQ